MVFSHSQVTLFTQCERKYAFKYLEKIPTPPEESLILTLGNAVHYALEFLYKNVQLLTVPTQAQLLEEFTTYRTQQCGKFLPETLDRRIASQQLDQFANLGTTYLQRYYETYAPFDQSIVMATEQDMIATLDDDITFRGKIDRIDVTKDVFTIVDYKTNRSYPKDTDETYKDQLHLYARGIQQAYGSKYTTLVARLVYLHLQNTIEREITHAAMEATRARYLDQIKRIRSKIQQRNDGNKDAFAAKECFLCSTCAYRTICPLFAHGYQEDESVQLDDMKTGTIKSLVDRLAQLSYQLRTIESEKDYLAKLLGQYGADHDFSKLYGFHNKVAIGKTVTYSPQKETHDALKAKLATDGLLDDVVDIDRFKLAKKIKDGDIDLNDYRDLIKTSVSVSAQRASTLKEKEQEEYGEKTGE